MMGWSSPNVSVKTTVFKETNFPRAARSSDRVSMRTAGRVAKGENLAKTNLRLKFNISHESPSISRDQRTVGGK